MSATAKTVTLGRTFKFLCRMVVAAGLMTSASAKDLKPIITTRHDGKTVVRFTEVGTGTWTIPAGVHSVELLVVGGGGGGCGAPDVTGGGGGGGGVYYEANQTVTPGTSMTVTVGNGGAGGSIGVAGGDSALGSVIAKGGNPATAAAGGDSGAPTTHSGGAEMGGGGGAGEVGASPWHTNSKGGDGLRCAITGTSTFYGGGGGTMYSGPGGAGGGGNGSADKCLAGSDGFATKGGGGGGGRHAKAGNGGSGVVIVAYLAPGATVTTTAAKKAPGLGGMLDAYNVVWDSPGGNSNNSMPLGNGDIGINAWVERNGDLVLYISKTDAWDENARLCKIGRVRVKFDPPLNAEAVFQQELKLREGIIHITSEARNSDTKLRIWVDADQPVVRIETESGVEVSCRAEVELWRLHDRPFGPGDDSHSGNGVSQLACKPTILSDVVVNSSVPAVVWYHRNTRSLYEAVLDSENLATLKGKFQDPLLNHTFGASLHGNEMVQNGPKALKCAKPDKRHQLAVCVFAERTATVGEWLEKLNRIEQAAKRTSFEKARQETAGWWWNFWNQSWVFVEEHPGSPEPSPVTQGYLLQRFISAAAGRGGSPIKFNGTIFNVPANPAASPETPDGDPDWRRWGGNYWFQNTRLAYWPMLATGNFDMMQPFFRMFKEALPLSMARSKVYYKLDNAALFPETMYFWGLPNVGDYGLNNPGPEMSSSYIRRHFNNGLELTAIMLEYYNYTRDEPFLRETLLPVADPLIAFFELYWPKRDAEGKIIFDPSQALETYQTAINPMPDVAGLHYVLPRLLALPEKTTTKDQRARWGRILKQMPPIPMAEANGKRVLRPAAAHGGAANFENPELYAVFPYKLYGIGSPDLDIGRATFAKRANRQNKGWCKDSMQAACLGLGEEAGSLLAARARDINKGALFPGFWGPNYDWVPDQDHGANLLSTLQMMLLQYDTASPPDFSGKTGAKIFLLPAWPKAWNASFKLHAPQNTTLEGEVRGGKLTFLKVTPKSREADVVNMLVH